MLMTLMTMQGFLWIRVAQAHMQAVVSLSQSQIAFSQKMSQYILKAGHIGCVHLRSPLTFLNDKREVEFLLGDFHQGIQVLDKHSSYPYLNSRAFYADLIEDAPILWIKAIKESYPLAQALDWDKGYLSVKGRGDWRSGDRLMISDCSYVAILTIKHIDQKGEFNHIYFEDLSLNLPYAFKVNSFVAKLDSSFFCLVRSPSINSEGQVLHSLYQAPLGSASQPILDGIQAWQIDHKSQRVPGAKMDLETIRIKARFVPLLGRLNLSKGRESFWSLFEQAWVIRSWG